MNPVDFQKVKAVFQSVLEIEPKKRAKFLDKTCRNDADLRREVESLLKNHESGFMEQTAIQYVADLVMADSLSVGEKIGRYEILSCLGKGGMGEVYLAHDKSLGRDVAIKVLLPKFTSDRERVNRFKLEAKAASALNHPNIITIHEVGEDEGKMFIATEHIKGETLRSLIEHQTLSLASSIKIAEQIASALTSAHKAGIIHRDIKPENIMIREDGFVKVLDFGLAKPTITNAEAETMDLVETKKGMIMGSVGYMSPEQARGKEVDARTDLWSVGVVFYELLTGKTPFQGETMTDILANIIHKEPIPVSEQIQNAPTELYRIVKKSLRKEADERYQSAKDLSLDLKNLRREMELEHELELSVSPERLQEMRSRSNDIRETTDKDKETDELQDTKILSNPIETQTSLGVAKVKTRYRTGILATIGIFLVAALGYFGYSSLKPKRMVDTLFNKTSVEKIPLKGDSYSFALSPDGKYLAFVDGRSGFDGKLILRQIETGSEKVMFEVESGATIWMKRFSSDGNYIFFEGLDPEGNMFLRQIAMLGGETKDIPMVFDTESSFSHDGKRRIFNTPFDKTGEAKIIISDLDGKNEKTVYSTKEFNVCCPTFSPDESKIALFYNDKSKRDGIDYKLGWIPATGGDIIQIGTTTWDTSLSTSVPLPQYKWLPDGSGFIVINRVMHKENAQIYLVSFPDGEVTPITNDTNTYDLLSATADGKSIVTIKITGQTAIWEYDLQTKNARQITKTTNLLNVSNVIEHSFGIAAIDDNKILFTKSDGKGNLNLWQINADGSDEKILVSEKGRIESPIVSPDRKYIYFTTNTTIGPLHFPTNAIWRTDINGKNLEQLTNQEGVIQRLHSVLPDNNAIIFQEWTRWIPDAKINKMDLTTGRITNIYEDESLYIPQFEMSPDGRKSLYLTATQPNLEPFEANNVLSDFDGSKFVSTKKLKFPKEVDASYCFANDDFFYYFNYRNRTDIWKYDLKTGKSTKVTNFNFDTIYNFTFSRDGKKLYLVRGNTTDEVVLIKNIE